ncbi:MAG: hypothetical protein A3K10_04280 [Bacteroidetes bacterium RIFCSPLOWO2_12_FULL_31_6]|nr:MAG: hypothetical protein A3K10_04280 [Bacteroidetes bacterium RIFCSPLOWO2_12_FULL_31_6]
MNIKTQDEPVEQMVRKMPVRKDVLGLMLIADKINNENKLAQIAKALPYMKIKKDEAIAPKATDDHTLLLIKSGLL